MFYDASKDSKIRKQINAPLCDEFCLCQDWLNEGWHYAELEKSRAQESSRVSYDVASIELYQADKVEESIWDAYLDED